MDNSITRLRASEISTIGLNLARQWLERNRMMKEWYTQLTLKDELETSGMESYVSNNPKTFFNLARHLLTPKLIPMKVVSEGGENQEARQWLSKTWSRVEREYRRSGKVGWLWELAGLMLATGWYAVVYRVNNGKGEAEVWNPYEVYPDFGVGELTSCAHIYSLTPRALARKVRTDGWDLSGFRLQGEPRITICDLYLVDDSGEVYNGLAMGRYLIKPMQRVGLDRIPVLIGPVSGLPDRGTILNDGRWAGRVGESALASNANVQKQYNRQMTFLQQTLRKVAQPIWFENTNGERIIDPELLYSDKNVLTMGQEDRVGTIPMPPLPPELRAQLFEVQNELQRGGFPWSMYGNLMQQLSLYLMSQVSESAKQVLRPFHDSIMYVLAEVGTGWLQDIVQNGLSGFNLQLPNDVEVVVEYPIQVPGDLVQRVTVSRMMNPEFRLSNQTTMRLTFPEIENLMQEEAQVASDTAQRNPVMSTIALIQALRERSDEANRGGLPAMAKLYTQAANMAEAQLTPAPQTQQAQPLPPGVPQPPTGEVMTV